MLAQTNFPRIATKGVAPPALDQEFVDDASNVSSNEPSHKIED